jgi:hypothetical protein
MDIFVQQLINGITLGSIYGLIAIGYTMVFGIVGMVNFAHGDVFMVSAFIGLITLLICTAWLGIGSIALALLIVLVIAMVLTSLVNWAIERIAYRPLRGSFRRTDRSFMRSEGLPESLLHAPPPPCGHLPSSCRATVVPAIGRRDDVPIHALMRPATEASAHIKSP